MQHAVLEAEPTTEKAVVKIGTRGSPLAMAQAYQTQSRLQAGSKRAAEASCCV